MLNIFNIISRSNGLFKDDMSILVKYSKLLANSNILVIGGAGSIGQAVVKELFKRNPKVLHVVDINENNLVELVRDLRSSLGYINGDFRTYVIDYGSDIFAQFWKKMNYDYVFNLSALKHVRSEKDMFSLYRMLDVNVFHNHRILTEFETGHMKKMFCVSTDKAANPANIMGATKRLLELLLQSYSDAVPYSSARFANVAFSDGSLLHGFEQRMKKHQPIAAPSDVKRYFFTPEEAGLLCVFSALLGENRDIYFPKLDESKDLLTFREIAVRYIHAMGYEPYECSTEDEARGKAHELIAQKKWPCYFFTSDTTGEKPYEEFFTPQETVDMATYHDIGVVKNERPTNSKDIQTFIADLKQRRNALDLEKSELVSLLQQVIPEFEHEEKDKNLDQKM